MAISDAVLYVNFGDGSTTGYYAITKRPQNVAVAAGVIRRQFTAPAVESERAFVCIVAGTTANVTDATWVLTRGAKTTDGTVTWMECTGDPAVNGDLTNTLNWTSVKNTGVSLGQIIQRNNAVSLQICTTAGTAGNAAEPAFSDTAGTTTADNTVTWTSLGAVGNFTGGSAPHARINAAINLNTTPSGRVIYVSSASAETQAAALAISTNSSANNNPIKILCVNFTHFPPQSGDLTTGASLTTTGTSGITMSCVAMYWYGITISAGTLTGTSSLSFGGAAGLNHIFENCSFQLGGTSVASVISIGGTSGAFYMEWRSCTVKFGNASQIIQMASSGKFFWRNQQTTILVSGSSVPTNLIEPGVTSANNTNEVLLEGLDLTDLSTNNLFAKGGGGGIGAGIYVAKDCKITSGFHLANSASNLGPGLRIDGIRLDSSGTGYISERRTWQGTETTETSITRVGGATDPQGQQQSRKIVTGSNETAAIGWLWPHSMELLAIYNTVTAGSKTVTVEGTINSGSVPNTDDIWMEVEYLGTSGAPLGSYVNTTKSNYLASGSGVTTSASSWNGGGSGAGWSPFKLTASIAPRIAGYIYVRVFVAKPSITLYVDPLITLS